MHIYCNQKCTVSWCGSESDSFTVKNGVRQGGVSSGIFFAVYIDDLLALLRKSKLGCHIKGIFYGALIYADDILLLSASRGGLQEMVKLCQKFVSTRNLKFGTNVCPEKSKTKCIVFSKKLRNVSEFKNILLDGNALPWVRKIKHLGHTLEADNSMRTDIVQKRGMFISQINSLLQEFHYVSADILMNLVHTYALCMYGSNLWDIRSPNCEKIYSSYNVAIRNIMNLDRKMHRFLIEPLSGKLHLKTLLAARYVGFYKSVTECNKFPVRYLMRLAESDHRTVIGRTLHWLNDICGVSESSMLTPSLVKRKLRYKPVDQEEAWKVNVAIEIVEAIKDTEIIEDFSKDELRTMLDFVCID